MVLGEGRDLEARDKRQETRCCGFFVLFSIHFLFRCSAQKILELTDGCGWKVEERGKRKEERGKMVIN